MALLQVLPFCSKEHLSDFRPKFSVSIPTSFKRRAKLPIYVPVPPYAILTSLLKGDADSKGIPLSTSAPFSMALLTPPQG